MFVVFVVVADSLSGSSYRLSQTLSLFLSECLIMTHRLWQDIWITLEAARLQMEADPVRQSLSNIYQWSVEAIFHCSHLLFNSVPEVSSFMSSSKLLDVSSEYFTMMHCFKMIVSNCGKVFSIFLISIDFLVKLMFHVNRLFFSSLLIFPNSCIFYISIFDWVAGQPNFINENSQKPNCKKKNKNQFCRLLTVASLCQMLTIASISPPLSPPHWARCPLSCIVVVWVWVPPIGFPHHRFPPIPNTVFSFMGGAIQSAFRAISSLSCEPLYFFYM